jgi:hypothetical protein
MSFKGKVVITGHKVGLGKAFYEAFTAEGFQVIGYDITEGKDLTNASTLFSLYDNCKDAVVFVNNAFVGQNLSLMAVYKEWKDSGNNNRTIINIGSMVTTFSDSAFELTGPGIVLKDYYQEKKLSDSICRSLSISYPSGPYIMNVKPFWIADTDRSMDKPDEHGALEIPDLINLTMYHWYNRDKYRVLEVSLGAP